MNEEYFKEDFSEEMKRMLVLVCSCCYNQIPQTGQLRNKRNLFLRVLKAGKCKFMVLQDLASGEGSLSAVKMVPYCCAPARQRGERAKGTNLLPPALL